MSTYRVAQAHHGRRRAVFDEYGRCVELVPAGLTDDQLAALITEQDRSGAYAPDRFAPQRAFDPTSQTWADVTWPVEEQA